MPDEILPPVSSQGNSDPAAVSVGDSTADNGGASSGEPIITTAQPGESKPGEHYGQIDGTNETSEEIIHPTYEHPPEGQAGYSAVDNYHRDSPDSTNDETEEEEGGGPVKTFLEHLEDLRWTIIKCVVAVLICMVACLSAGKQVMSIVTYPLVKAKKIRVAPDPRVILSLGEIPLGSVPLVQFSMLGTGTNLENYYKLAPVTIGTNTLLTVVPDLSPSEAAKEQFRVDLKTFSPGSVFTIVMQVAFFGGMTVAAPFVLFFLGQFILPALHVHEKRFLYRVSGFSTLLFFTGIAFCYFVLLPITFSTTTAFSNWMGFKSDEWRADDYISFTCWFLVGMGASFQLPLVLLTLVKIGLLTASQLSAFRMYWVVAGLVISGFITPDGNPMTMLLMFLPLHFLYEVSVIIAWFWKRKESKVESISAG